MKVVNRSGLAILVLATTATGLNEADAQLITDAETVEACEVLRLQIVSFDGLPSGLGVDRVKVEPVPARYEGKRLFEIHAEFCRRPCLAGMVSSDGEAAADLLVALLEASDVVALPAVERQRNRGKRVER